MAADESTEARKANEPVKFSVAAGASYTDNRDALPTKVSNTDLYITPRLVLDLKYDELNLALSYAPTYRYRSNASIIENDSQLLHDFAMTLNLTPSRMTTIRLVENFNLTDDPSVQQDGATLRRDSSFIYSQTEVGMAHDFSAYSKVDVAGRYMVKRYDDAEVRKTSDVTKSDAGITYWKQPAKKFALVGMANYAQFDYEKYLDIDRGFDSTVFGLGIEQEISSYVKYGLRGGLQSLQYRDDSLESANSPYGTVSLQVNTLKTTRILLSVSQMVRDSAIFPFASQDSTDYGVSVNWESPSSAFQFVFAVSYRVSDYSKDTVSSKFSSAAASDATYSDYLSSAGIKSSGKEETLGASVEVGYKLGDQTTIKLVQSYEDVSSGVRWSYDRNATTLAITRDFR